MKYIRWDVRFFSSGTPTKAKRFLRSSNHKKGLCDTIFLFSEFHTRMKFISRFSFFPFIFHYFLFGGTFAFIFHYETIFFLFLFRLSGLLIIHIADHYFYGLSREIYINYQKFTIQREIVWEEKILISFKSSWEFLEVSYFSFLSLFF